MTPLLYTRRPRRGKLMGRKIAPASIVSCDTFATLRRDAGSADIRPFMKRAAKQMFRDLYRFRLHFGRSQYFRW